MSVAFDAKSTLQSFHFYNTPLSFSSGNTAGADRYGSVSFSWIGDQAAAISSVTWDGSAMTSIGRYDHDFGGGVYLHVQKFKTQGFAPPTGVKTIVATFNQASDYWGVCGAVTYTGVDQTTPTDAPSSANNTTSPASVTIATGATGDMVEDVLVNYDNVLATALDTERFNGASPIATSLRGSIQDAPGAASVVMDWTYPQNIGWLQMANNINAGGAGGAATAVTLSGPSGGYVEMLSSNFTAGVNGSLASPVVFTPTIPAGGGYYHPTTVTIPSGATPAGQNLKYIAIAAGAHNITGTDDGGLTDPAAVVYTASALVTAAGSLSQMNQGLN